MKNSWSKRFDKEFKFDAIVTKLLKDLIKKELKKERKQVIQELIDSFATGSVWKFKKIKSKLIALRVKGRTPEQIERKR
jgi:hypothetical protein